MDYRELEYLSDFNISIKEIAIILKNVDKQNKIKLDRVTLPYKTKQRLLKKLRDSDLIREYIDGDIYFNPYFYVQVSVLNSDYFYRKVNKLQEMWDKKGNIRFYGAKRIEVERQVVFTYNENSESYYQSV